MDLNVITATQPTQASLAQDMTTRNRACCCPGSTEQGSTGQDGPSLEQNQLGMTLHAGSADNKAHITYHRDGSVTVTIDGKDYFFNAGEARNLVVDLGDGNDMLTSSGNPGGGNTVVIRGGRGNDTLHGSKGADNLEGGDGNDLIYGGKGNDYIKGGAGNDYIDGGKGGDKIYGGTGNDEIYGGRGNYADTIYGGAGDDRMYGGRGNDYLHGGSGDDIIRGGSGADVVIGGAGLDQVTGNSRGPFQIDSVYQEERPSARQRPRDI